MITNSPTIYLVSDHCSTSKGRVYYIALGTRNAAVTGARLHQGFTMLDIVRVGGQR